MFGGQRVERSSSGKIEGVFTQDKWDVFYYGVTIEGMTIVAQMQAGRDRRTSNKKASRAAEAAREPELIAIGRGRDR